MLQPAQSGGGGGEKTRAGLRQVQGRMEVDRVEFIRDTRKFLIDRLPVAVALYQDDTINFPARRQFLLDWLLDSFYRLLKSGSQKIEKVLQSKLFWDLFAGLFEEGEGGGRVVGQGKRRISPLTLSKPILPIFAAFLTHFDHQQVQVTDLVVTLMGEFAQREDLVIRNSQKSVEELLKVSLTVANCREDIYSQTGKILAVWTDRQNSKKKLIVDMGPAILALISRIPDRAVVIKLLDGIFGAEEVVKQLAAELGSQRGVMLSMILSSGIALHLFLERFGKAATSHLPLADSRMSTLKLFHLLVAERKDDSDHVQALFQALSGLNLSNSQSDAAWTLLKEQVALLLPQHLGKPQLLRAILDIDLGLVVPHYLEDIISSMEETVEWNQLLLLMAEGMARVRQLDLLCLKLTECPTFVIPASWGASLVPPLRILHAQVVPKIIEEVLKLVAGAEHVMVVSNALQMLCVLNKSSPHLFNKHIPAILSIQTPNPHYSQLLGSIAMRSTDDTALRLLEDYSKSHPEEGELPVIIAIKQGSKDLDVTQLDQESRIRLLPSLTEQASFELNVNKLPSWVFGSLLFWESVHDGAIDALLAEKLDNIHELVYILQRLPMSRSPNALIAAQCIRALIGQEDFPLEAGVPKVICKLLLVDRLELDRDMSARIFALEDPLTRWLLVQKKFVSLDTVVASSATSIKQMLLNQTIIARSELPESLQDSLVEIFEGYLGTANGDDDISVLAANVVGRCAKGGAPLAGKVRPLLGSRERLSFELALMELGVPDLAQVRITDAIQAFLDSSTTLTARDVGRVVRLCDQTEKLRELFNTTEASITNPRYLPLLDILMLQSVEIQSIVCPLIDRFIASGELSLLLGRGCASLCYDVLLHRLACGGKNIGALSDEDVFAGLLKLISQLSIGAHVPLPEMIPLMTSLLQYHWSPLMRHRPTLIALLCRLVREIPDKCGRLLGRFAHHRQLAQSHYVLPLLLTYSGLKNAHHRKALRPAMAGLVRFLDQAREKAEGRGGKYFDADPLERLMKLAPSDDARIVLKELISAYNKDYKYTGKV